RAAMADEIQGGVIAHESRSRGPHRRERPGRFGDDARPFAEVVPSVTIEAEAMPVPVWHARNGQLNFPESIRSVPLRPWVVRRSWTLASIRRRPRSTPSPAIDSAGKA